MNETVARCAAVPLVALSARPRPDGDFDVRLDERGPFRFPPMDARLLVLLAQDNGREVGDGIVGYKSRSHLLTSLAASTDIHSWGLPLGRPASLKRAILTLRKRLGRVVSGGELLVQTRRNLGFRLALQQTVSLPQSQSNKAPLPSTMQTPAMCATGDPSGRGRVFRCAPLEVDLAQLRVTVHGRPVLLSGCQLRLLLKLCGRPGWVFTRAQLLAAVFDEEYGERRPKAVDVLVCRLRKRLGKARFAIENVRMFGYRIRTQ